MTASTASTRTIPSARRPLDTRHAAGVRQCRTHTPPPSTRRPDISTKRPLDIEEVLTWCFRHELPKRRDDDRGPRLGFSSISPMFRMADLGVRVENFSREPGMPAALGEPHPDALIVEAAVLELARFADHRFEGDLGLTPFLPPGLDDVAAMARAMQQLVATVALLNPVRLVVSALKLLRFAIIGTGVGALLVGLAAAGTAIYNNWTGITKAFTTFKAGLSKALGPEAQGMLAPVVGLFERIGMAWSDLTGKQSEGKLMMWGYSLVRSLGEALNSLKALKPAFDLVASGWDALKTHFTSGGGDLFANTAREFESVKSVFTGIVDLAGWAKAAIEQIPVGFATLMSKAQEAWNGVKSLDWAGLGAQIVSAIAAGITAGAGALVGALKGAAQFAWNSAKGVFGGGGGGGAGNAAPAPGGRSCARRPRALGPALPRRRARPRDFRAGRDRADRNERRASQPVGVAPLAHGGPGLAIACYAPHLSHATVSRHF
ncbi:hypothetical protein [Methylobacterium sp. WL69]|uniref:hypothetical protein n=1 Tax=Methylobacterium sp. WL69 TaxID=2603893 RepID=UPI00164FDEFA|nr:hypothetical protein [Methylobacterium sp. WL69]